MLVFGLDTHVESTTVLIDEIEKDAALVMRRNLILDLPIADFDCGVTRAAVVLRLGAFDFFLVTVSVEVPHLLFTPVAALRFDNEVLAGAGLKFEGPGSISPLVVVALAETSQMKVVLAEDVDHDIVVEAVVAREIRHFNLVPLLLADVNAKHVEELLKSLLLVTELILESIKSCNDCNLAGIV